MGKNKIGILHYSAPPVIGGVESVINAHAIEILRAGYSCKVISGRGQEKSLPLGVEYINIPEIDSNYPEILIANRDLETGVIPNNFKDLIKKISEKLKPILGSLDHLIVHNVLTKHFNLALTKSLYELNRENSIKHLIAWCHDFTWSSPTSRSKVFDKDPWNLLKTKWENTQYVTISYERQKTLADLFGCSVEELPVIYSGVDPEQILGLSRKGWEIIQGIGLMDSEINIIMPVRITKAKNIEFAIKVAASLKEKGVDSRFVITGPPDPHNSESMEYFRSLIHYCEQLHVRKNIRFIFESGGEAGHQHIIDGNVVGDLYRVSDLMFMPSHYEGFGIPVIEAALTGTPVLCSAVPAVVEIAGRDANIFSEEAAPDEVADMIMRITSKKPSLRFKIKVRREYTWNSIFDNKIQPLLEPHRE